MPVSCNFQGCKALLRTGKRRYIKYHAFAFFALHTDIGRRAAGQHQSVVPLGTPHTALQCRRLRLRGNVGTGCRCGRRGSIRLSDSVGGIIVVTGVRSALKRFRVYSETDTWHGETATVCRRPSRTARCWL